MYGSAIIILPAVFVLADSLNYVQCRTISLPPLFSKIYTVDLLLLLPAVFVLADSLNYVEVVEPSPFLPYFLKYLDLLLLPPAVFAAADSLN